MLRVFRKKKLWILPSRDLSFMRCRWNVYQSIFTPENLPYPEKFLSALLLSKHFILDVWQGSEYVSTKYTGEHM